MILICSRDSQNPQGYRRIDHLRTQVTSGFSMYLRLAEIQLMCCIPTWEWTVFGCQTVPIGCNKYMISSVSLFRTTWWQPHWTHCELKIEFGLPWYKSRNPSVDLQSIPLLALQPQGEWERWQWTGQAIRYALGMYLDHGYGGGVF